VLFSALAASYSLLLYYHSIDTQEIYLAFERVGFIQTPTSRKSASIDSIQNPIVKVNLQPQTGFPIIAYRSDDFTTKDVDLIQLIYRDTDFNSIIVDSDMIYRDALTELPLFDSDYYFRKYENGKAGAIQLNNMPILTPGKSIGVIRDKYINIRSGYVQPPGYYYGSGVCWSTSTLGAVQDKANADFKAKFGYDLFTFRSGDRSPHPHQYQTYTNNHRGYTIFQVGYGVPATDYRFTVNPQLKNVEALKNIKLKIVMIYSDNHPSASHGQSLGAYILSNVQF
jgi:hypothetical protein